MKKAAFFTFILWIVLFVNNSFAQAPYLVGYWHNWNDGSAPYIPLDQVDSRYNVVNLSFAIASPGNDYDMTFPLCCGETQAGLISKIQALQANGTIVNISIGGATDPVHLTNASETNIFISTMNTIINTYGFDGLDIDLEGASLSVSGASTIANPTDASVVNFITAIQQIFDAYQSTHGKKMFLSAAPETAFVQGGQSNWGGIWGAYLPVLDEFREEMDLLHVQLYNSGSMFGLDGAIYEQGTADFIVSQTEATIIGFNAGGAGFFNGFPAHKLAVGLPACPSAAGGGFTSTATVKAALDYLMGNGPKPGNYSLQSGPYPDFGGMMTWSVNWDAVGSCNASAYEYATNFEDIFLNGTCLQPDLGADISACGLTFPTILNSNTSTNTDVTFTWTNLDNNQVLVANSATSNTFTISAAGTYRVQRDSIGCSKFDIITISADLLTPNIPSSMNLCAVVPESINVANAANFPTGTTWAWYKDNVLMPTEINPSLSAIRSAGTYLVEATFQNCTAQSSILVSSDLPEPMDACGGSGEAITLGINVNSAGPFDWYAAATGGASLGTGTSFTTPNLTNTTTYYVEDANSVGSATTGPTATNNNLGALGNWLQSSELYFDADNAFVLKSFALYPLIWCDTHTISLEIRDANNTLLTNGSQSFAIAGDADCNSIDSTPTTVTLSGAGIQIPQGTGYKIVVTSSIGLNHWTGPIAYPMDYSPFFTITGGNFANYYLAIHDWEVEGSSCARLPVIATIDAACGTACPTHLDVDATAIPSGLYQSAQTLFSTGTVPSGAVVSFKAGQCVELNAGFSADLGGELEVVLEGCNE